MIGTLRAAAAALAAALLSAPLTAQQPAAAAPRSVPLSNLRYEVAFDSATAQRNTLGVTVSFDVGARGAVLLSFPTWTPGAYEVSNFARFVTDFSATAAGKPLDWDKLDYDTWRIDPAGARSVTVRFDYRAASLDNAMAWSRPDFAFVNGTNVFPFPEGRGYDFPATVTVKTQPGWLVATALAAQTTGRIEGRIVDDAGAPLPGVAVVATGPSLPGEARIQSADDGSFRMVNLPPGVYTVNAALDGFNTVEQRDVKVGIDRTVSLELTMVAAFTGEVTVLSEAPVVDVTNATSGVSVSAETFEKLPLARDFYAIAQIASGAATDAVGTTFYGSTGAENQYVIEGLNTTGGRYGDEGKTLNFDFIQEVEVKTGGLPAEYGRLTGGLINAITRSGGNEIEGSAFGFYQGGDLQSDNSTASETPETQATVQDIDSQYDVGFTLGGAFVEERGGRDLHPGEIADHRLEIQE